MNFVQPVALAHPLFGICNWTHANTLMLHFQYMKKAISLGVLIFGSLGGWLGTVIDHGNGFGGWAILLTAIGSFVGIWVGYKIAQYYL